MLQTNSSNSSAGGFMHGRAQASLIRVNKLLTLISVSGVYHQRCCVDKSRAFPVGHVSAHQCNLRGTRRLQPSLTAAVNQCVTADKAEGKQRQSCCRERQTVTFEPSELLDFGGQELVVCDEEEELIIMQQHAELVKRCFHAPRFYSLPEQLLDLTPGLLGPF